VTTRAAPWLFGCGDLIRNDSTLEWALTAGLLWLAAVATAANKATVASASEQIVANPHIPERIIEALPKDGQIPLVKT
jgi:hypothetical protein